MTECITIFPRTLRHAISPFLYGHFIEHAGGCVNGGIWVGEDSEIPNIKGMRTDTVEALLKLEVPVLRWPGGLFADNYHWMDGIGPRSQRPVRYNLGWDALENNHFGTDEFMALCRMIGAEPYLCCNIGTGTVEEARSWAEYCNCDKKTTLADMRRRHGSVEPYGVRFWGIGNEPYYCLDGMMTTSMYTEVYRRYAGYVKRFASQDTYMKGEAFQKTKLLAAIADADFLKNMDLDYVDLIATHLYSDGKDIDPHNPETAYRTLMSDLGRIRKEVERCCALADAFSTPDHSIDVAVDEWGTWHWGEATPLNGLTQSLTLQDAIFAAACLHIFQDQPKVYMANLAQTVNVLQALIRTDGPAFALSPTYYVFEMFKPHKTGTVVPHVKDDGLDNLSVSVTVDRTRTELTVSIVNTDPTRQIPCRLSFADEAVWKLVRATRLYSPGIREENTFDEPNRIVPECIAHEIADGSTLDMPPHAIVVLSFRAPDASEAP